MSRHLLVTLVGGLLAAGASMAAPPVPVIEASRTQGVAPLAVHFSAVASTSPDYEREFHTLKYEWDFDDPEAGSWRLSGASKNRALGPVAGHLFVEPGVYLVSLRVTDPAGASALAVERITVRVPDHAIGKKRTWCFANPGAEAPDWSGCPLACDRGDAERCVALDDFDAALAAPYCDTTAGPAQCLFRRGDAFRQDQPIHLWRADGPGLIGAFGSGERPVVDSSSVFLHVGNDWRVAHLDWRGDGTSHGIYRSAERNVSRMTVYDVSLRGATVCIGNFLASPTAPNRQMAYVDVACDDLGSLAEGWAIFGFWEKSLFLGLEIDNGGGASEGAFRTAFASELVIQHGRFTRSVANPVQKGTLQLRACGQAAPCGTRPDRYNVVSDNVFVEAVPNSPVIRTCTQRACSDEGSDGNLSQDILFERNLIQLDDAFGAWIAPTVWNLQSADVTIRDNVVDLTGIDPKNRPRVVWADVRGPSANGAVARDRVHVLHNTVILDGPSVGVTLCGANSGADHVCANNLVYAPDSDEHESEGAAGQWTAFGNLREGYEYAAAGWSEVFSGDVYPGHLATTRESVALAELSPALGAGVPSAAHGSQLDARGRCRLDGQPDVGAVERGAPPCVGVARDGDGDGIPEDGDASGVAGDGPCWGGQRLGCDDNCPLVSNAEQSDRGGVGPGSRHDGHGDACQCGDLSGDGRLDLADALLARALASGSQRFVAKKPELCNVVGPDACDRADADLIGLAVRLPPQAVLGGLCPR
jgi:hypothetical protein